MLTRSEALRRILQGLAKWEQFDSARARFVRDEVLEHRENDVVTAAENVVQLDQEDDWRDFLDPARSWLNATLHFDTDGEPVISLRCGPPRPAEYVDPATEVAIAVSVEPKPLRLLK